MEIYWNIIVFIFGLIIGSFLNVLIYRLHTGKSINGRSHCMSCGETLSWYELFPLASYLMLRARCRHCSAYIPLRYLVVELFTGTIFLLLWSYFGKDITEFLPHAVLSALLIVILVYDIRHTIIPDELVLGVLGIVLFIVSASLFESGSTPTETIAWHVVAGMGAASFFYVLWYVSKGKWIGLGDAKLAFPLGFLIGSINVFSMIVLSFWVGAALSLSLMGTQKLLVKGKTSLRFFRTPLTIQSEVPFAPYLIVGFVLVYFLHADIFTITAYVVPSLF